MSLGSILLLVFAFVCLLLAAVNVAHPRINLSALGLAAWVLATILMLWK